MRKRIIKLLLPVVIIVSAFLLAACSDEYVVGDIRFVYPSGGNYQQAQSTAFGDNYILRVRNKQLALFKTQDGGLNSVGFYDSGRSTPSRIVAHGDNFAAFSGTETVVEIDLYSASDATPTQFSPAKAISFAGDLHTIDVFDSTMYVTAVFSERHYGESKSSKGIKYTEDSTAKDIIYSSVDEYDYRGFVVMAIDLASLTLVRPPLYICGLAPQKISTDGVNIYTQFGTYKGKGAFAEQNGTIFSIFSARTFESKGTINTGDEVVDYTLSGENIVVVFSNIRGKMYEKHTYKFMLDVYDANLNRLGKHTSKIDVGGGYSLYGHRYDHSFDGNTFNLVFADGVGAVIKTTINFSNPKKITEAKNAGQSIDNGGLIYNDKLSDMAIVNKQSSYHGSYVALYDRKESRHILFEDAESFDYYNFSVWYEDGYFYGYNKGVDISGTTYEYFIYKQNDSLLQLIFSKEHFIDPVLSNVAADSMQPVGMMKQGTNFLFLTAGYIHTYDADSGEEGTIDTRKLFKVSFDSDGGSAVPDMYLEKSDKLTTQMILAIECEKPGFELTRWVETDGKKLYNISSDLHLKAVWASKEGD